MLKRTYKHYKGGIYIATGSAILERDGTSMVIYHRDGEHETYVRPASEFHGTVTVAGDTVKRFEEII